MKALRGASESSTTSDNTTEFIDIVQKYDVVYNTHNPDYKNVDVKMRVWSQIADEIGLSVEASKRKWKNLRDSYTKYLRSFRIGTKTSKKYQFWAHAEHMEFLKPYQGPGRNATGNGGSKTDDSSKNYDEEDTEDLGFQVLAKAQTNTSSDDDLKLAQSACSSGIAAEEAAPVSSGTAANATATASNGLQSNMTVTSASNMTGVLTPAYCSANSSLCATATMVQSNVATTIVSTAASQTAAAYLPALTASLPLPSSSSFIFSSNGSTSTSSALPSASSMMLPMPSLPTVQLPPTFFAGKTLPLPTAALPALPLTATSSAPHMFPMPAVSFAAANGAPRANAPLSLPTSGNASNVGCLILEPQMFASTAAAAAAAVAADNFKKEFLSTPAAAALSLFQGLGATNMLSNLPTLQLPVAGTINQAGTAAVNCKNAGISMQKSRRAQAMNLSAASAAGMSTGTAYATPPAAKKRSLELDVATVLQANRELDSNTLFFLSLARTVRQMPKKFQSLAKMRCMRIVSDLELELESACEYMGTTNEDGCAGAMNGAAQRNSDSPNDGSNMEHFVYCMSPSRVESMIDISSEDEISMNGA